MAIVIKTEELPEKGKSANPETKHIQAGNRPARLVSYVELGKHQPMFKGKPAIYDNGKMKGKQKPAVLHVALTFEFTACEYTGDYPLTISTTRRMDNGDFFDAVTVPDSLIAGTISKSVAMRTKFMKFLTGLQAATGLPYPSIADFAKEQVPLIINVTNKKGAAREDGSIPVYANMKPEGITSPKVEDPMTGEVTDYSSKILPVKGEYCTVFDWDAPTEDAWRALKPWDKDTIKKALNFKGSPIHQLLTANPELDRVVDGEADGNPAQDDSIPPDPTMPGEVPADDDIPF
jgi:hypothetical protein